MSSDNGIYLLQTLDGYRVTHAQCIDNLYWWPTGRISEAVEMIENEETGEWEEHPLPEYEERDILNPQEVYNYFKYSSIFETEYEALNYAYALEQEYGYVEYGVSYIEGMEKINFPKGDLNV